MGINIYNDNEDKFSETLKALKDLPKVNAPDDFEFNLMIKITNGEFEPEEQEKRQSKLLWILAPAAMVVSTIILFVTFSKSELDQQLNPLLNQGSIYTGKIGDSVSKGKTITKATPNQGIKRNTQIRTSDPVQEPTVFSDSELPLFVNDYRFSPLSKEGSFKLDNLLRGNKPAQNGRALTAKSGDGFIPDDYLQKVENSVKDKNAVRDSVKKMVDSLKWKKNIKR